MTEHIITIAPFAISIGRIEVRALRLGLDMSGGGGGGAPAVTPSTWNPADQDASITLSAGNLKAATSATYGSVRSTLSKTAKVYYETLIEAVGYTGTGFANSTASLASFMGSDSNGVTCFANGEVYYNGALLATVAGVAAAGIRMLAINPASSLVWFGADGVWTGDPAAGSGGLSVPGLGATIFASFSGNAQAPAGATANFGASAFSHGPPSGFSAWDS